MSKRPASSMSSKRPYGKKPRNKAPKTSATSLVRKEIAKYENQIKRWVDYNCSATIPTALTEVVIPAQNSTGTDFKALNGVSVGSGAGQRDGNKITVKHVTVSGCVYWPKNETSTGADVYAPVRLYIVVDRFHSGEALTSSLGANMFVNLAGAQSLAMPLRNLDQTQRYRVLATHTIQPYQVSMTQKTATEHLQDGVLIPFEMNWKGSLETTYKDEGADHSNIIQNAIFFVALASRENDSAPARATVHANSRVRYLP